MTRPIVIIGAGGFGREVHDVLDAVNAELAATHQWELLGFLDDTEPEAALLAAAGVPLLGAVTDLEGLATDVQYVIGIGTSSVRRRIDQWAVTIGRQPATLIHPTAVVGSRLISIGSGSVLCATACVTTNVRIGRHVHLNLGVTVGHDTTIGDYVTANPNACISGAVVIEDDANLGTGATVIQGRRVGARTVVGAGAAVVRDLPPDVVAIGVPARVKC